MSLRLYEEIAEFAFGLASIIHSIELECGLTEEQANWLANLNDKSVEVKYD